MRNVLVIGLDGCNPDLVYKWIEELPNIKRLMEEGIHGRIESSIPITRQAWTVVLSGRNPGHFGFWAFLYRDDYTYGEPKLVNATVIQVDTIYDILPRYGRCVAIISVPVTYPPVEIASGYCISSFLALSIGRQFTHPPGLRQEVEALGQIESERPPYSPVNLPTKFGTITRFGSIDTMQMQY